MNQESVFTGGIVFLMVVALWMAGGLFKQQRAGLGLVVLASTVWLGWLLVVRLVDIHQFDIERWSLPSFEWASRAHNFVDHNREWFAGGYLLISVLMLTAAVFWRRADQTPPFNGWELRRKWLGVATFVVALLFVVWDGSRSYPMALIVPGMACFVVSLIITAPGSLRVKYLLASPGLMFGVAYLIQGTILAEDGWFNLVGYGVGILANVACILIARRYER